ncbi:MAG: superoxide dismutase family protein [Clostridia bacterium]|nr:superoxide dismutase family protein [Clostridia bacterium]
MLYNYNFGTHNRPLAYAKIKGSDTYPEIVGTARFYSLREGVLVSVMVRGLPQMENTCQNPIFAVHIHGGTSCTGNQTDPFANALTHYNPKDCPHPYHAGDMPPIFSAGGLGFSEFLTNRFTLDEIIGKTIVIHSSPDDFTTQPSGNSGTKIACGVIKPLY